MKKIILLAAVVSSIAACDQVDIEQCRALTPEEVEERAANRVDHWGVENPRTRDAVVFAKDTLYFEEGLGLWSIDLQVNAGRWRGRTMQAMVKCDGDTEFSLLPYPLESEKHPVHDNSPDN